MYSTRFFNTTDTSDAATQPRIESMKKKLRITHMIRCLEEYNRDISRVFLKEIILGIVPDIEINFPRIHNILKNETVTSERLTNLITDLNFDLELEEVNMSSLSLTN